MTTMDPMERSDHILIVDDDAEIRSLLTRYLEKNGLRATAVGDGRAMWRALDDGAFDLIVLDLMLPGDDGLTLCRTLRGKSDIPVIMLTARGDETDRIVGLEMGADDYLPKPFSARELLARIKVILRRTRSLPPNLQPQDEHAAALRRLDAGHRAPPAAVARRRGHADQRGRVQAAARLPGPPQPRAQPRPAARPDPGPRGRSAGPQHRRAGQPTAPAPGRRPAQPGADQDRARRGLCAVGAGRARRRDGHFRALRAGCRARCSAA